MNLPNWITLFRFALIPVYLAVFLSGHLQIAFGVIVLAGLTDVLDGYLARRNKQVTEIGKMLDPLADKSMMITVILTLLYERLIPWEAALAIFVRDAGMIIGTAVYHFRGKKTVSANIMGKLTTAMYYFAILFIFFEFSFAITFLWIVIVISFVTSAIYVGQVLAVNRQAT